MLSLLGLWVVLSRDSALADTPNCTVASLELCPPTNISFSPGLVEWSTPSTHSTLARGDGCPLGPWRGCSDAGTFGYVRRGDEQPFALNTTRRGAHHALQLPPELPAEGYRIQVSG